MAQINGEVKWFNNMRGYGLLGREDGPDVFIHYSAIDSGGYKSLNAGDPVSFEIVVGDKGKPQAARVRRISAEAGSVSDHPVAT